MRRNNEEPDFQVFAPSKGTNKLLDPTQINSLDGGPSLAPSLESGNFIRNQQGMLAPRSEVEMESYRASNLYKNTDTKVLDQYELLAGKGIKINPPKKHEPRVRGGGPRGSLRTPKKMFSSFGRGVPFSGGMGGFFKAASSGPALGMGSSKHFIQNQGLFDMGITAGPRMLQGMTFNGAFPIIHFQQFNTSTAARPHDSEEED